MTLLSDVIIALHDAEVPSYSVHSSHNRPGDPDLVVITDGPALQRAIDALLDARLGITAIRRVQEGVLHLWCIAAQRGPSALS